MPTLREWLTQEIGLLHPVEAQRISDLDATLTERQRERVIEWLAAAYDTGYERGAAGERKSRHTPVHL
jgi:hypothetical protein